MASQPIVCPDDAQGEENKTCEIEEWSKWINNVILRPQGTFVKSFPSAFQKVKILRLLFWV